MAQNPAPLYHNQPAITEVTLYTVPLATVTDIKELWICNTTAIAATITLSIVPSGGTAGPTNRIMTAKPIAANDFIIVACWEPMLTGSFISGLQGTAAALTVRISGVEWS